MLHNEEATYFLTRPQFQAIRNRIQVKHNYTHACPYKKKNENKWNINSQSTQIT